MVRGSVLLATRRAVQRAAVVVMCWLGQRQAGRGVLLLQGAYARVRAVCVRARARVCMCRLSGLGKEEDAEEEVVCVPGGKGTPVA